MKKKGNPHKLSKGIRKRPKRKVSKKWGYIPKKYYFCEICKTSNELEVHHIVLRKDGGTNHRNNLMILCHKHHMNIHHPSGYLKIKKKYEELLKAKFNKIPTP